MLDTVAVVGGEIISVTVAVTLKRLVWGETAGPCVSDDHRTCGGDVFIIPPPPESLGLWATQPDLCPPSRGGSVGLRHWRWALQPAAWDPRPKATTYHHDLGQLVSPPRA